MSERNIDVTAATRTDGTIELTIDALAKRDVYDALGTWQTTLTAAEARYLCEELTSAVELAERSQPVKPKIHTGRLKPVA